MKKMGQFLERLIPPCHSFFPLLAEFPSGAWVLTKPANFPGLLRLDWGGLSASFPSGKRNDACGLRRWCKFLVLEFYWYSS